MGFDPNVPTNGVTQKTGSTREERIAWANEVFAKLLLSGAVGVDVTDTLEEIQFPRLTSLVQDDQNVVSILDTLLFKPSDDPNKHEPVHRIVAEFCAARYLAVRVDDSSDTFSLRRCMTVIAPNSVVRDELRGLLGWMAALGTRRALADVGLDGPEAAIDIHDLRTLLDTLRMAHRTAWQTIVRLITTGLLLALIAGIAVKLKLFG